ncbi:MAG TPA: phosphatidylserine decarboxylase [Planctomycetota bacterium]|nr:phosphatidylserine decarboxylase [Planctomycetota bacterium]
MRFPLTHYAIFEILVFTVLFGGTAAVAFLKVEGPLGPVLGVLSLLGLGFVLNFFRDPNRRTDAADDAVIAPADGKVTDIVEFDHVPFLDGPAIRIGIFLSVFDVHVNRTPVAGEVAYLHHRPGSYLDARDPSCADLNEAQDVGVLVKDHAGQSFPVMIRQISGLIARRIVCAARVGQTLKRGERYGMIKVGSRTEVYLPKDRVVSIDVPLGTHVRGGEHTLARLRMGSPGQKVGS